MNDENYNAVWGRGFQPISAPQKYQAAPNSQNQYSMVVLNSPPAHPQFSPVAAHPYANNSFKHNAYSSQSPAFYPYQQHSQQWPQQPVYYGNGFGMDGSRDAPIKPVATTEAPLDNRLLLLSLSDQYIDEARSLAPLIIYEKDGANISRYHKLIATAIACLQVVLKKVNKKLHSNTRICHQIDHVLARMEIKSSRRGYAPAETCNNAV